MGTRKYLLIAVLLSSCASAPPAPPPVAAGGPSAPVTTPAPATAPEAAKRPVPEFQEERRRAKSIRPHIAARASCMKDSDCAGGYGAYGYLIFTSKPDAQSRKRFLSVCDAYLHDLRGTSEYPPEVPRSILMTTFWLLDKAPQDKESCNSLIDAYDYARASEYASLIGKQNAVGPILIASEDPLPAHLSANGPHGRLLWMDLSRFTEQDMDQAIRVWMGKITEEPEYWKNSFFDMERLALELRSFIQKYGPDFYRIGS